MQTEKIILGIDPGTAVMGFGIISVEKGKMKLIAIDELILKKYPNHEIKLKKIFDRTLALIGVLLYIVFSFRLVITGPLLLAILTVV